MKRKRLRIHSQAQQEINEAFDWYFKRSPEAAEAFLTEIGASMAQIASHPLLYPPYTKNTRRRVLPGFPYSVIFQEKDEIILIVAVAHAKRRPGYWRKRV
ncbi:MAG: type II toxin-antitoxin system RelE/ParE family toxin [Terracidiphilus sp.]|jgi:plasmid stabilization system protein ParE